VCQPHRCVGDGERAPAAAPGADDNGLVGLYSYDSVEFQDAVRIGVAVRGRADVLGMWAGVRGELLLVVDYAIAGPDLPCHVTPPFGAWTSQ